MKKPWDSFEKNYVAVEIPDPKTGKTRLRYEYCGPWYVCRDDQAFSRTKWLSGALLVICIIAVLWAGTIYTPLNRLAWTSLPYGLSLAAMVFAATGVCTLLISGPRMKQPEYKRTDRLLGFAPAVMAGLLMIAILAGIILILTGYAAWREALPLTGWLPGCACMVIIHILWRRLRFVQERNTEFEYDRETIPASAQADPDQEE